MCPPGLCRTHVCGAATEAALLAVLVTMVAAAIMQGSTKCAGFRGLGVESRSVRGLGV